MNNSDTSHYENVPFEVPEGWCWTTIEDLLINRDSERIPLSLAVRNKQHKKEYNYYGAAGVIDKVEGYLFSERLLLIGEDGANLLSRAKDNAFFADGKYWVNNHAHVLDCSEKEVLTYVALVINSMALDPYVTGSAQPKLSQDNLNKILIPLPPLAEQRRIIYAINNYSGYLSNIENDKESIEHIIDLLKQLILNLAITGKLVSQELNDEPAIELLKRINPSFVPADNRHYENVQYPDSWEVVKMGEMVRIISGVAYSKSDVTISGIKVIRGGNIQAGEIIECDDDVYIDSRYADSNNNIYKGDIVLVASTGSQQLIGKTGFATRDYVLTQIGAFLRILRPKDIRCADFLNLIFQSDYYREYIRSLAKGTNINNVKNSYIDDFVIGLPPLQEQNRIVAITNKIFYMMDEILADL